MTINISIPADDFADAVLGSADFHDAVENIVRDLDLSDALDTHDVWGAIYEVESNVADLESRLSDLESDRHPDAIRDAIRDEVNNYLSAINWRHLPQGEATTHPGKDIRRIAWTTASGGSLELRLEFHRTEMQFDLRRFLDDGTEDQKVIANLTADAARLLRDRLDYFLSQAEAAEEAR